MYVLYCTLSAAYLHIRVWRYPLEGASSLVLLNIVPYIRSSCKKRGLRTWLNVRPELTFSLCLVRINVSEPSSSVMDIDGIMKLLKKLLFTKSMQESSKKLRILQRFVTVNVLKGVVVKSIMYLAYVILITSNLFVFNFTFWW